MKCRKCQFENPADTLYCGKCGALLTFSEDISVSHTETLQTPKEELTTGSTFAGRYQIIEELGKGGMGRVYKVIDQKIKEKVALKLIKPEVASDEKTIERFGNELKMARKVTHKNVCRMYHLGEAEGTHYITMEYVRGEDLKGMIGMMGQLSPGQAVSIAKQVCGGLTEAHRLGVVHRDLKPQNIMIDREGNARIMDFGIARSIKAKKITGAGVMIGTPEYMSPEQVEGKEVDQRSDIYSLGVILYEMVTGRVPFEGDTPFTVGVKHKSEMPQDPKTLNAQIPEDLSHVILRCLEKEKEKRYQSAGEVCSELARIEKGIPTTEKAVPKRKPLTSKEITVTFGLKKLFIPASVFIAVAIIAGIIWLLYLKKGTIPVPSGKPSIAVLPFADFSQQKDQEYLCDGMTDEIIAKLSGLEGWKVISRTSVMRYKNIDKGIKEIGQELDVAAILEGSVRREEDDIRVTAQLVNVEDGFPLWSGTYDQKLERVFVIQSDVAEKIVKALKMKLSPLEKERLQKKPTENLEAYNLYLQGCFFWGKRNEEELKKAIEYFEGAIEKDPSFAMAYLGLAESYAVLPEYSSFPREKAYAKVNESLLKALEIDNTRAEAHASLAYIKMMSDWDWEGAERKFKRAIELNPNYATAHHWYAINLLYMARFDEAIAELKRALELDPLSLTIRRNLGAVFFYARQYEQARATLQKTIEMDPDFSLVHFYLGRVYFQKSMYEEALEEFQKKKGLAIDWVHAAEVFTGITYLAMGMKDGAQKILEKFLEPPGKTDISPGLLAISYFSLGEKDQGFRWLNKAYEERDIWLIYLKIDPLFDSVRPDPRYKALLKKMGLD